MSVTRKNRILQRSVLFLLIILILVSSPTPAFALDDANTPSAWAAPSVSRGISLGVVPDSLQSKYSRTMTRGELAVIASSLIEKVTGARVVSFTYRDTNGKIVTSNEGLTREQASVMLWKLINDLGIALSKPKIEARPFSDEADIASWALDSVKQIYSAGIMSGVGNNYFAPKSGFTREQGICILMNIFDLARPLDKEAEILKNYSAEIVRLVNIERAKAGVTPLTISPALTEAAGARVLELEERFSHTRPDGREGYTVIDDIGFTYETTGENLAKGYTSPKAAMDGWSISDTHKKNMLYPFYNNIGVGVYRGASGKYYWAQIFTD